MFSKTLLKCAVYLWTAYAVTVSERGLHQQYSSEKRGICLSIAVETQSQRQKSFLPLPLLREISKWASRGGKASGAVPGPRRLSDALIMRLPSIPSHTPHSTAAPIQPPFYPSLALVSSQFTYPYVCVNASRLLGVHREWEEVFVAQGLAEPFKGTRSGLFQREVGFIRAVSKPAC